MKTYQTTIDGRRRRVTVPENDDAMLNAIAAELSPQAVAVIATRSNRSRQPTICRDLDVERQPQKLSDSLVNSPPLVNRFVRLGPQSHFELSLRGARPCGSRPNPPHSVVASGGHTGYIVLHKRPMAGLHRR